MEDILTSYFSIYKDITRCFCHKSQKIKFKKEDIKLFQDNDQYPQTQFLLSYHYYYIDQQRSLDYIQKAISQKFVLGYNLFGCLVDDNNKKIDYFNQSIENGFYKSYLNLGHLYYSLGEDVISIYYLNEGTKIGMSCCETAYLQLYDSTNQEYFEKLLSCAKKGCRTALDLIYDKIDYRNIAIEIGTSFNFTDYIIANLKNYTHGDRFKYIQQLGKYEKSHDPKIIFYIGKQFLSLGISKKGVKLIYKSIKLGYYKGYKYLVQRDDIDLISSSKKNILMCNLINKRNNIADELNLFILYLSNSNFEEALKYMTRFDNDYSKYLANYIYYLHLGNNDLAYAYLEQAYHLESDPESKYEKININFDMGMCYLHKNNKEKAIEFFQKGVEAGIYKCNISIADLLICEGKYVEACNYLIVPVKKKSKLGFDLLDIIIQEYPSVEIGQILLENDISIGVLCFLRSGLEVSKIIELCKDNFMFENYCDICLNIDWHLKFACGHSYCVNCLVETNDKCPFCRVPIKSFIKNII
jgi:tetratricopeptide (TPR) repeat protein